MALATPTFAIAAALAATPNLESAPYIGDPPAVACQYSVDDVFVSRQPVVNTPAGDICRFKMQDGMADGVHNVRGRFVFKVDGVDTVGPASNRFYFRLYRSKSGTEFWTWENGVVCETDCEAQ